MVKFEKNHLKAIIIVHGKSEKQICEYIKSKLRLRLEIYADKNGEKSIQITSVMRTLENSIFKTKEKFLTYFQDAAQIKGRKAQLEIWSDEFRIFIIMDTDDCTENEATQFKTKEMFKKHWAYEYIVPIWNSPNLEEVLVQAKIPFKKRGEARKSEYIKLFPTNGKYAESEKVELEVFKNNLMKIRDTNMSDFIDFCLKSAVLLTIK